MTNEVIIKSRISLEAKHELRDLAVRRQMTESALVRHLIESVLEMAAPAAPSGEVPVNVQRNERLYVRLAPEDRARLFDRAQARGLPSATYVSVLVRAHLHGVVPIPKEEMTMFRRAIGELSAIGRNVNQLAKAAHQTGKVGPVRDDLQNFIKVATGMQGHVKAILKANESQWRQGHAKPA